VLCVRSVHPHSKSSGTQYGLGSDEPGFGIEEDDEGEELEEEEEMLKRIAATFREGEGKGRRL